MAATDGSNTHELLAALRHPLRRRILRAMAGREEVSPSELAEGFGLPLSNVSYHVRVLEKCGVLELVGMKRVRGVKQHFYRSADMAGWARSALGADGPSPRRKSQGEEIA